MQSATRIWQECLAIIKDNVSPESYRNWFEPIIPVKYSDNKLTIRVPSPFFYEYLEENYIELLSKALKRIIGPKAKLEYEIVAVKENANNKKRSKGLYVIPGSNTPPPVNDPQPAPAGLTDVKNPHIVPGLKKIKIDSNLNTLYTFDNFVEGDCNKAARNFGLMISKKPGNMSFNPYMIYGPTGTGKTHLAQAIGLKIKELFPHLVVLYIEAHEFEAQYAEATRNNERPKFIAFYKLVDVLIVDDVHEFASKTKEKTQMTFFQIFNQLYNSNKQLILTSDRPPAEMRDITERLLSRFKAGLTAELKKPDFNTRYRILKNKAYQEGFDISDRVLRYIAETVTTNIRELYGALNSVVAHATAYNTNITIELAKNVIKNIVKETKRNISVDYIKKVVSDYFNIEPKVLNSKTRTRDVALARQITMYLARKHTDHSLSKIGAEMGGKDHSTVLYACRQIENLIDIDKNVRHYLEDIERSLKY